MKHGEVSPRGNSQLSPGSWLGELRRGKSPGKAPAGAAEPGEGSALAQLPWMGSWLCAPKLLPVHPAQAWNPSLSANTQLNASSHPGKWAKRALGTGTELEPDCNSFNFLGREEGNLATQQDHSWMAHSSLQHCACLNYPDVFHLN